MENIEQTATLHLFILALLSVVSEKRIEQQILQTSPTAPTAA
jgi:hypothetical protein